MERKFLCVYFKTERLFCWGKSLTLYFDQTLSKPGLYMIRLDFGFF